MMVHQRSCHLPRWRIHALESDWEAWASGILLQKGLKEESKGDLFKITWPQNYGY